MKLDFVKYDGAGNDFVLVDIRHHDPCLTQQQIADICHRRFGVGADGLMTLGSSETYDFEMRYYNSDGALGSMCGNGGRCIAAFADSLGLGHCDPQSGHTILDFVGYDGPHRAEILMWDDKRCVGLVRLGMRDVKLSSVRKVENGSFLDTGSPHFVLQVNDLKHYDVVGEGRRLRHRNDLFPEGANIDFVENLPDGRLFVRTYERGVEDETYACGTGVTACAIVSGNKQLQTLGGDFKVEFSTSASAYTNIWLTGPVSMNFNGEINI